MGWLRTRSITTPRPRHPGKDLTRALRIRYSQAAQPAPILIRCRSPRQVTESWKRYECPAMFHVKHCRLRGPPSQASVPLSEESTGSPCGRTARQWRCRPMPRPTGLPWRTKHVQHFGRRASALHGAHPLPRVACAREQSRDIHHFALMTASAAFWFSCRYRSRSGATSCHQRQSEFQNSESNAWPGGRHRLVEHLIGVRRCTAYLCA